MPAGFTSVRLLLCYNFYEDFFRSLLTCTQRIALCYHRGGEYYDYK